MEDEKKFPQLIRSMREGRGLTVAALAELTDIPAGTIYAYESGRRGVPRDKADTLRDALATSEEFARFEASYTLAVERRSQSPLHTKFGSETTTLRVAGLQYPPFSGTEGKSFVNRFLAEMLNLAVIRIIEPSTPLYAEHLSNGTFDLEERMRWIAEHDAHVIINLQSPMRMRALKFLCLPIRVSLNAVIMTTDQEAVSAAQRLLVDGLRDPKYPFRVIAVKNEVGYVYLKESCRVSPKEMATASTLNPRALAKRLEQNQQAMLVCDEVTALAVIAEIKTGEPTLVLPASTDQTVMHVELRRKLPAHYLGLGVGRDQENDDLVQYLTEAIKNFLSTELEVIAAMLEDLYVDLVSQTKPSFENNSFLYSGDARGTFRRHSKNVTDSSHDAELDQQYQSRAIETMIEQNARSFARRCLNISKRSISDSDDLWPWRHVLRRARERVLIREARNRAAVREIVVSAMKSSLGLDPTEHFRDSYKDYFQRATSPDYWQDFKDMLERELDITLPSAIDPMSQSTIEGWKNAWAEELKDHRFSTMSPFKSVELVVSALQRAMEDGTGAGRPVSVRSKAEHPYGWDKLFSQLWSSYSRNATQQIEPSQDLVEPIRLVAFSLGKAVGFVTGHWNNFRNEPALLVEHLYVNDAMKNSGVSRRLIRAVIDSVAMIDVWQTLRPDEHWECRAVWIRENAPPDMLNAFIRTGFTYSAEDGAYFYRLYGLRDSTQM